MSLIIPTLSFKFYLLLQTFKIFRNVNINQSVDISIHILCFAYNITLLVMMTIYKIKKFCTALREFLRYFD